MLINECKLFHIFICFNSHFGILFCKAVDPYTCKPDALFNDQPNQACFSGWDLFAFDSNFTILVSFYIFEFILNFYFYHPLLFHTSNNECPINRDPNTSW